MSNTWLMHNGNVTNTKNKRTKTPLFIACFLEMEKILPSLYEVKYTKEAFKLLI